MQKSGWIWMDGNFVPWDEANVHVLTHTLHYGLGVFEGIRCYRLTDGGSAIFRLAEHDRRLFESAHVLGLEMPFSRAEIDAACIETVRRNGLAECYLRPLVFLGDGKMGLAAENPVRVAIAAWPWGAYLGEEGVRLGVRAKTSSFWRFHSNTFMPRAKSVGNYLNSILASREVQRAGYDEAILLDTEGFVAEGSGENLFVIRDGVVSTPEPYAALSGITAATVTTLLRERGHEVRSGRITRDDIYIADEVFMTGTAAEVVPVRELDDRRIGDGRPGPITCTIQKVYAQAIRGELPEHRDWLTPIPA